MARVVVPLEVFRRGQFPPVCVKTGRPAESVGQAEAVAATGGAWWLIRLLPMVKHWWPAGRRAMGDVPITRAAVRRIAVMRWAWVVTFLAGGWIMHGAGSGSMLLAGRLLVALAGVLWLLAPLVTVEGCLDPEGGTVELYDVHPRFKAAVEHGPVRDTTQPARDPVGYPNRADCASAGAEDARAISAPACPPIGQSLIPDRL